MSGARIALFLGSEVVAAVAAAKLQSDAGASIERQIAVALGVIGILTFAWAVARFILKPLLNAWVFAVLGNDPARLTEVVIEGLDKNDRTRATARGFVDRLYADTLKQQQETKDMAEANRDRLVFLEEAQARMGESLTKDFGAAVREATKSNEQQTQLMREIQQELRKLSESYARLDERFNSIYDGPDRRRPKQ